MKMFFKEIKNIIFWNINRKTIQKQIEEDDMQYNDILIRLQKAERKISKLKKELRKEK